VEWLRAKTLSSSPSTAKKKNEKESHYRPSLDISEAIAFRTPL
jgi:hypothetical protein